MEASPAARRAIGAAGENALAWIRKTLVVWLVDGVGIHKSTDGGATFQTAAHGRWLVAIHRRLQCRFFAVFASDLHNVYATFDGGLTWTTVASGD